MINNLSKKESIFFSLKRFLYLIYYEIKNRNSFIIISLLIFCLLFLFLSLSSSYIEKETLTILPISSAVVISNTLGSIFFAFYLCYFFFTSKSLNLLHFKEKGIWYYILPCSQLEKFLSKFTFYLLIYPTILFICLTIFALIADSFRFFYLKQDKAVLDILINKIKDINYFLIFLIWSLFFLNSIIFKKNSFLKTILMMITISIFISITYFGFILNIKQFSWIGILIEENYSNGRKIIPVVIGLILTAITYLKFKKITPR